MDDNKQLQPSVPKSMEQIAAEQQGQRELQEKAAAQGKRPNLPGQAPRINNFFIIKTSMEPQKFVDFIGEEVLGSYEARPEPCGADFGMITMRFISGLPKPGAALPMDAQGRGVSPLANVEPMIIAKLDAGPWPWYDRASTAILESIVRRLNCRAWCCGWAMEKEWSWVEHWRPHRRSGQATMTETIDGPSNGEVTRRAAERWGINVRDAFDALHQAAQFEALRQWLVLPEPRPLPFTAHVSFLAGKLLIQGGDDGWIPKKWDENFPGRKPQDGPLHLQRYYLPGPGVARLGTDKKERALDFHREPPSSLLPGGMDRPAGS